MKLDCAILPLIGIRVGCPGYIDVGYLVKALGCIPRALPDGKEITLPRDGLGSITAGGCPWNADVLCDIDHVCVAEFVVRCQALPGRVVTSCYASKSVTACYNIGLVTIRTIAIGKGVQDGRSKGVPKQNDPQDTHDNKMSNDDTSYSVLLKIVP